MKSQLKPLTREQRIEQARHPVTALQVKRAYNALFGREIPEDRTYTALAAEICEAKGDNYAGYLFIREQSNDPSI